MVEPRESGPEGDQSAPEADALAQLQERLDRASQAAERLIAEAAAQAAAQAANAAQAATRTAGAARGARKPPPAGWQQPADGEAAEPRGGGELELVLEAIGALRDRIPPELQHRLGEALREVLLALRALIDWYLERTEHRRSEPVQAQDIPIV